MKTVYFIPLIFLTACSTAPKLTLRPQQPPPAMDNSAVRYPEVVRAYHFGRYVDPNDGSVMHEEHVAYRVEQNTRWNFHPDIVNLPAVPATRDAAFSPVPVNDAILAEVNSQRLATAEIIMESRILSAALAQFQFTLQQTRTNLQETARLRVTVNDLRKRLDALESAQAQPPASTLSATNELPDSLAP